jgi:drug/metabolite transporter (DMT)-like permease
MGKTGVALATSGCVLIASASLLSGEVATPLIWIGAVLGVIGAAILVYSWSTKR